MIPDSDAVGSGEYINVTWRTLRAPGIDDSGEIHDEVLAFAQSRHGMFPCSDVVVVAGNDLEWYASVTFRMDVASDGQSYATLLAPLRSWSTIPLIGRDFTLQDDDYADRSVDNIGSTTAANKSTSALTDAKNLATGLGKGLQDTAKSTSNALTAVAVVAVVALAFYVLFETNVLSLARVPRAA